MPLKQMPSGQYGGFHGAYGVISLYGFTRVNKKLLSDPLQIQCASESAAYLCAVLARDSVGMLNPINNMDYKKACTTWQFDGLYPDPDSPPIEIQANYALYGVPGTNETGTSHTAMNQNVSAYFTQYAEAFAEGGTYQSKIDFLVQRHGLTDTEAAGRLAEAGYAAS